MTLNTYHIIWDHQTYFKKIRALTKDQLMQTFIPLYIKLY
jgi:hypothetical protein